MARWIIFGWSAESNEGDSVLKTEKTDQDLDKQKFYWQYSLLMAG